MLIGIRKSECDVGFQSTCNFIPITTRCGRRKSHVIWLESGDASRRIPSPYPIEKNQ